MPTGFTPLNELEELLVAAATDPTARPRFCRALLDNDLFVLAIHDESGIRIQTARRGDEDIVPVFSSLPRLEEFAREVGLAEYKHEQGTGRELLTILETAHVVLNPVSDYGKEFYPREIRAILDGSELKRLKIIGIDESQPALFSQPSTYPQELVDDLKASFAFGKAVKRAYLAQIHQTKNRRPQLVVGIEADEHYRPDEAMEIARESLADDEFITFLRIGSDPLSTHLLRDTKPFYVQAEDNKTD